MLCSAVVGFAILHLVVFANPVPQSLNDDLSSDPEPGCSGKTSMNQPRGDDDDEENQSLSILRRQSISCPATGYRPSPQFKIPKVNTPTMNHPSTAPADESQQQSTSDNDPCGKHEEKYQHLTCGGPEILNDDNQLQMVVNCIEGQKNEIPKRVGFPGRVIKYVAQYCCEFFFDNEPGYVGDTCVKITPQIPMAHLYQSGFEALMVIFGGGGGRE